MGFGPRTREYASEAVEMREWDLRDVRLYERVLGYDVEEVDVCIPRFVGGRSCPKDVKVFPNLRGGVARRQRVHRVFVYILY